MNKIKDFIYDKNDIVIALLILAAAAFIIFWRLDIILEYPKILLGTEDLVIENPVNDNTDVSGDEVKNPAENTHDQGKDESGSNGQTGLDEQSGSNSQTDSNVSVEIPLWDGGMLTEDVEVEVSGNSAAAAVGCLIDTGLFESYDEYKKVCENAGLDHEKVAAGTFTFKKGASKETIAKQVNWG